MAGITEQAAAIAGQSGADAQAQGPASAGSDSPGTGARTPATKRLKVIKFSHVSKRFTLHHERARSFQEVVVNLFGLRTPSRRGVAMPRPANEEFWALRDVNFSIYAGEAVGIIGENGSGKSTTLKLISRILEPTSGGVSVRGKVSALLELGTGFHPDLTGSENIFLNGSLLGISRRDMAQRYDKIVDFSELHEFIDTPIKHYSSGMVMRLAFAVAINVDPDILLTDEVLAVGDEAFQRKCLEYIADLRRKGVTIIFVSHALDAVRALCSRTIWLDHGRLIADGPSGEVIDRYLSYENERHIVRLKAGTEGRVEEDVARPAPLQHIEESDDRADLGAMGDSGTQIGTASSASGEPQIGTSFGSGEIQITGVTFLNGDGEESAVAQTGKPWTIRMSYDARKPVDNPVFGLALFTANGTQLNGPNTRFSGFTIPRVQGTGHVDYTVDKLPLLAGTYDLTVAVTGSEMSDILDHRHRAFSFVVQPTPDLPERWGLLYMPSRWAFHPDGGEDPQGT